MMYHDLLQAYSRTNRVEKETKPWGIIVAYRNLKKKTDDALALFSQGHAEGVLTQPFEFYVQKFNELVSRIKVIAPTPASIDMLYSEDDQKEFVVLFRELKGTYSKFWRVQIRPKQFGYDRPRVSGL